MSNLIKRNAQILDLSLNSILGRVVGNQAWIRVVRGTWDGCVRRECAAE